MVSGERLVDTVARLQQDLADVRAESRLWRTPGVQPVMHTPRQAAFTTTEVPRFGGTTSWEQYRQICDAIVLSSGWDDATAVLQLLSHLEGDALNVTLLVPMSRRTSRMGLVDALSAHYAHSPLTFTLDSVPPEMLWTDAESGRVTQTQGFDGSVSLVRNQFIRPI